MRCKECQEKESSTEIGLCDDCYIKKFEGLLSEQVDKVKEWEKFKTNPINPNIPFYPNYYPYYNQGWICPKCGGVNSPSSSRCLCTPFSPRITFNSGGQKIG